MNNPNFKVYSTYFMFTRVPAGQTVQVEAAAGDAVKVGICFFIDAPEIIT